MLLLEPSLRALSSVSPRPRLILCVDRAFRSAAEALAGIDDVIAGSASEYQGGPSQFNLTGTFDAAVDLQGTPEAMAVMASLSARLKVGFDLPSTAGHSYHLAYRPRPGETFCASYHGVLRLLFPGLPPEHPRIPHSAGGSSVLRIRFAPGGSAPCKRWSWRKWHGLILSVRQVFPAAHTVLLTDVEAPEYAALPAQSWIRGRSLRQLRDDFQSLDLAICNESALLHLAATSGCRAIGLFGFGSVPIWTGYSDLIHPVFHPNTCVRPERVDCERRCTLPDCLEKISVEDVLGQIAAVIRA